MFKRSVVAGAILAGCAMAASAQVFPSGAHTFYNFIPFGSAQTCTMHQVFDAALFGNAPVQINSLGYAPNTTLNGQQVVLDVTVSLGYTDRIPGVDSGSGGLSADLSQNPVGEMTVVFSEVDLSRTLQSSGTEDFSFVLEFETPFCYDPSLGNLLVEIVSDNQSSVDLSVSRTNGSSESSRAYNSSRFGNAESPTTATRMLFDLSDCTGGLALAVEGECPGTMTAAVTGATPGGTVAFIRSFATGNCTLPPGPCEGTELGLSCNGAALLATDTADAQGNASVSGNAPAAACGRVFLQAVDLSTCSTSNVEGI